MPKELADQNGEKSIAVRRGRVESVDLYEIKDNELDTLERGTPADLQLNFAVFLISIAFSAIAALSTSTFANESIKTIFIIVAVVGVLLGMYLLIAWKLNRSSVSALCKKIRQRIPNDAGAATIADPGDAGGPKVEEEMASPPPKE